jgi:FMN phosphatase YigB (HAD superfamily)
MDIYRQGQIVISPWVQLTDFHVSRLRSFHPELLQQPPPKTTRSMEPLWSSQLNQGPLRPDQPSILEELARAPSKKGLLTNFFYCKRHGTQP